MIAHPRRARGSRPSGAASAVFPPAIWARTQSQSRERQRKRHRRGSALPRNSACRTQCVPARLSPPRPRSERKDPPPAVSYYAANGKAPLSKQSSKVLTAPSSTACTATPTMLARPSGKNAAWSTLKAKAQAKGSREDTTFLCRKAKGKGGTMQAMSTRAVAAVVASILQAQQGMQTPDDGRSSPLFAHRNCDSMQKRTQRGSKRQPREGLCDCVPHAVGHSLNSPRTACCRRTRRAGFPPRPAGSRSCTEPYGVRHC